MKRKKRAAAMAAVYAHIRSSEEHQAQTFSEKADAAESGLQACRAHAGTFYNIWGVTGRQSLMQANTMMQLRMFK